MRAAQARTGMAHGVHRAEALLEGDGAHRRGDQHIGPRLDAAAILHRDRQPVLDEAHAFERDALRQRMEERARPGLQRMAERVHARPGGDLRRQADRELRILDDEFRLHLRVEDDLLGVVGGIGDDRGAADFGARAGGGRHRDDRRDAVRIGARPPVLAVLEVPDRAALAGHEGDRLADIHRRAAAEGDHAVMAAGTIGCEAVVEIGEGRVAVDLGEDGIGDAGPVEHRQRLRDDRQPRDARIGHEERPRDARRLDRVGQLADAPGAEADRGRIGPVGSERGVAVEHDLSGIETGLAGPEAYLPLRPIWR